MFVPIGAMALLGFRPDVIETARGVNLLYQYWIHTETIPKLGPVEEVFNTASHHRVHHGSNRQYLDRNHGSIFIIWDRLFGTFEREDEPVALRPHQEHRHLQPGEDRHPRAHRHPQGRRVVHIVDRAARASSSAARAGPTTATPSAATWPP